MAAAQLRIYTINKGKMDEWLALFHTHLVHRVAEAGMGISSSWVNVEKSQFIWIRTYESLDAIAEREAVYYSTDWWAENVEYIRSLIAHREIIEMTAAADG